MLGYDRTLTVFILLLNPFMDSYKSFIAFVFIAQGIIATIDLTDFS